MPTELTADDIAANIADAQQRIADACKRAGRDADAVTLVAVTKTHPMDYVRAAVAAGIRDLGENKVQELQEKADELPGAERGGDVRWNYIGHLQSKKSKDILGRATLFHALDSLSLADTIQKRAERDEIAGLDCFVQVNVSGEDSKFGLEPDDVHAFVASLRDHDRIRIKGLMTLAAPTDEPESVRPQFALLRRLGETFPQADHPDADLSGLSMGMSGDYEIAIEEGATHVRLGSTLFGARG